MSNIFLDNFKKLQEIKKQRNAWPSIKELAEEISVNHVTLNNYHRNELLAMGFKFKNIQEPFIKKYADQLEKLLKDGKIEWETFKDLVEAVCNENYLSLRHNKKKVEELGFNFTGIKNVIESNIDKLNSLIDNNETKFDSVQSLMNFIQIDTPMQKHKERLESMGFEFSTINSRSFLNIKSKELTELIDKKETKLTIKELADKLLCSEQTVRKHNLELEKMGFELIKEDNPLLIKNIDKLNGFIENNETNWTKKNLAKELDCTSYAIETIEEKLKEIGISFYKDLNYAEKHKEELEKFIEQGKNTREDIKEFALRHDIGYAKLLSCKKTLKELGFNLTVTKKIFREKDKEEKIQQYLKEGRTTWNTYKELMDDLGFERIRQRKKGHLIKLGFKFHGHLSVWDKYDEKLQDLLDKKQNKWPSIMDLLREIDAEKSTQILKKRDELISRGFEFVSTKTKLENLLSKVIKLKENGITSFETIDDLSQELGYENSYVTTNIDAIEENGVHVSKVSIGNLSFIDTINEIHNRGILFTTASSLKTTAKNFFNISINTSEKKLETILGARSMIVKLSVKETEAIIQKAIETLLRDDTDGFSLRELSYQVLKDGYSIDDHELNFFCDKHDDELLERESIFHRIRLAKRMEADEFIAVEFTDKLPIINNLETPTLIVDKAEQENMYELWQKFILFAFSNLDMRIFVKKEKPKINKKDNILEILKKYPELKTIETLFLHKEYKEAFSALNWGGMLALYLHCLVDNESKKFSSSKVLLSIFLLWSVREKKCLLSPTFLKFKGNQAMLNMAAKVLKEHKLLELHNYYIDNADTLGITSNTIKKLTGRTVHINIFISASCLDFNFDPLKITIEDFIAYSKSSYKIAPTGSVLNSTYMETILKISGNKMIAPPKERFDAEKNFNKQLSEEGISGETLSIYDDFISHMRNITTHRFERDRIGEKTIVSTNGHFVLLMRFLDTLKKRLDKNEMTDALNTLHINEDIPNITNWAKLEATDSKYAAATTSFYMLFENLPRKSEYKKIYERKWIIKKETANTMPLIIRDGFEPAVYETLQYVAYHKPASTPEYPTRTVAPNGELLDMNWWKHKNSNPVIAICTWLITKLPRRGKHIRNLDVNKFLQYKQSNGEFYAMYINTDKNQKKSANNRHILARYVKMIFNDEELKLLENYVQYIKDAFSNYKEVPYENQTNNYSTIQPLFPSSDKQAVMGSHIISGHYNKTLVKTEFELKKLATKGGLDKYYENFNRKRKIDDLLNTDFCYSRLKKLKSGVVLEKPKVEEEFLNSKITISQWYGYFQTDGGIHNLRGAGATYLMTVKSLHISQAIILTGHTSTITLLDIYFKGNDTAVAEKIEVITGNYLDVNKPVSESQKIIEKILIPIAKSLDPEKLEKALRESNFMSLERTILSREHEDIYGNPTESKKRYPDNIIDDGIKIASKFHPDTYEVFHHGICTINRRCPAESNQECCFCPHLLFNVIHLEGIRYKLQKATHELALNQDKMKDPEERKNSDNIALYSQEKTRKIAEIMAWNEMLTMVLEQIDSFSVSENEQIKEDDKITPCIRKASDEILGVRAISSSMMSLETLELARKININDNYRETQEYKVFSQTLLKAVRRNDKDFIINLEKRGIDYIMENYGAKTFEEKVLYHKKIMSDNVSNSLIESGKAKIDRESANTDDVINVELLAD